MKTRKEIEDCLAAIAKREGTLKVDSVIEEARNPESPLHGEFDWNDTTAAENWRKEQARTLIRSVNIIITVESHQLAVPAYVRDPNAKYNEQGFSSTLRIRSDKEEATQALMSEIERIESALRRARLVASALGLEKEIDGIITEVLGIRKMATKKAAA